MIDPWQLTFVDAAGLVAVLDRTIPGHQFMGDLWRLEFDSRSTLVTTNYSVVKAALDLQQRHGLAGIADLFRVTLPALRVEWCTRADHDLAVAALMASSDTTHDLVDCVDEQVKERLRITSDLARL